MQWQSKLDQKRAGVIEALLSWRTLYGNKTFVIHTEQFAAYGITNQEEVLGILQELMDQRCIQASQLVGTPHRLQVGEVDIKKLNSLLKKYEPTVTKQSPAITSGLQVRYDYIPTGDMPVGKVIIAGHKPLVFRKLRAELINFFYSTDQVKEWKGYADIKQALKDVDIKTSIVNDAVDEINERFKKYALVAGKSKYMQLIEKQQDGNSVKSPYSYRWAL